MIRAIIALVTWAILLFGTLAFSLFIALMSNTNATP